MNLHQLARVTKREGKNLAKRLRREGVTADEAAAMFSADPVCRHDAEPWIAVAYLRRWERKAR